MSRRHPGSRHHKALNARRWAKVRRQALDRDAWRCRTCGKPGRLEVDHIRPLEHGGPAYELANLQTLCRVCHLRKTAADNGRDLRPRDAWDALVARFSG